MGTQMSTVELHEQDMQVQLESSKGSKNSEQGKMSSFESLDSKLLDDIPVRKAKKIYNKKNNNNIKNILQKNIFNDV